jgi:hypothetical protein
VTYLSRENNIAFTDLFDVFYRASIDCSVALDEWNQAAQLSQGDHYLLNTSTTTDYRNADKALKDTCHMVPNMLKMIYISGSISPQP